MDDQNSDADRNWCGGPQTMDVVCGARLDSDGTFLAFVGDWILCEWTWVQSPNHTPWIFHVSTPTDERSSRREVGSYNLLLESAGRYVVRGVPLVDGQETCVYDEIRVRAQDLPEFRVELIAPDQPGAQSLHLRLLDEAGVAAPNAFSSGAWGEMWPAREPFFEHTQQQDGGSGALLIHEMEIRAQVALWYASSGTVPPGPIEATVRVAHEGRLVLERTVSVEPDEGRVVAGIDGRTGIVGPLDLVWSGPERMP